MKNINVGKVCYISIMLVCGFALASASLPPCPCANGTLPYQVDCNNDGTKTVCEWSDCPAPTVDVTSGGGDVKEGCSVTWDCSVSDGSGNYDYLWYFSTGNAQLTSKGGQTTAAVLGPGTATVTVTDTSSGKNANASQSYHVREEYEVQENSKTNDTVALGSVTAGFACPHWSDPCTHKFIVSEVKTHTTTFKVEGGGNISVIKVKASVAHGVSISTSTGSEYEYTIPPGQEAALFARANIEKHEGSWQRYDCSGQAASGTWNGESPRDPDLTYYPMLLN